MADLDISEYGRDPVAFMTLLEDHYVPTGQLEIIADFVNTYAEQIDPIDLWRMGQMINYLMAEMEPQENKCRRQRQQ